MKKQEEFKLSDKIKCKTTEEGFILTKDVKEFIRLLKENFEDERAWEIRLEIIDKLSGELKEEKA
jgi:hypothetical protein